MAKPTKRQVKRWLLELMARQAPQSVDDAERNAETATPAFSVRFEAATFCQEAQDHIAGSIRYWNEAAVSTALEAWCASKLAPVDALPPKAEAAPISTAAKVMYARFLRSDGDISASAVLNLMRSVDAPAFEWVIRADDVAASFAVRRGWVTPSAYDLQSEWSDSAEVEERARTVVAFYRELSARPAAGQVGLRNFRNWQAVVWQATLSALQAALTAHDREQLPIVSAEFQAITKPAPTPTSPPARRPLFG